MATNPVSRSDQLSFDIATEPTESVVRCTGRITSNTMDSLKSTVKPLISAGKTVVVDFTNVDYLDSSGLGTIVGLYVAVRMRP